MTSDRLVFDLHCDLLLYLAIDPRRRPWDALSRCSLAQMRRGGVGLQALAVYSQTGGDSVEVAARQVEIYRRLEEIAPGQVELARGGEAIRPGNGQPIRVVAAIENASGFAAEDEPLDAALARLDSMLERLGSVLYVSLTWNDENRFGGGNVTDVGLKPDGEVLLDYLSGRGVAIDFSHTSDALAEGILERIDAQGLDLRLLASHSGLRAVHDVPRNLPDRFARELVSRDGLLGFNLISRFAGPDGLDSLLRQVEHALDLGAADQLAIGADFFSTYDMSRLLETPIGPSFYPGLDTAACYPRLLDAIGVRHGERLRQAVARGNAEAFAARLHSGATTFSAAGDASASSPVDRSE